MTFVSFFYLKNASTKSLKGNEEKRITYFEISFLRNYSCSQKIFIFSMTSIICYKIFLIDQINFELIIF